MFILKDIDVFEANLVMATLSPDAAASQCRSGQTVAETTSNRQHITASTTDGSQSLRDQPERPRTTRKSKQVGKRNRTVTPPDMVRDPRANNDDGDDDNEMGLFQFDQRSESPFSGLQKRRKTATTLPTVIDTPDVDSAPVISSIRDDLLPNRAESEEVNVIFEDSASAGINLGEGTPEEPVRRPRRDHRARIQSCVANLCDRSLASFSYGPVYEDCSDDEY